MENYFLNPLGTWGEGRGGRSGRGAEGEGGATHSVEREVLKIFVRYFTVQYAGQ